MLSMSLNPDHKRHKSISKQWILLLLGTLFLPRLESFTRNSFLEKTSRCHQASHDFIRHADTKLYSVNSIEDVDSGNVSGKNNQIFESFMNNLSIYFSSVFGEGNRKETSEDSFLTKKRSLAKDTLLQLIQSTPQNAPTSIERTEEILNLVSELEKYCPTPNENVLAQLGGNWELLWTAQDQNSPEVQNKRSGIFSTWINPLENQSYSNNPSNKLLNRDTKTSLQSSGRSNPILPRQMQDRLEQFNLLKAETRDEEIKNNIGNEEQTAVRSSQSINLKKKQVRNVVSVQIPQSIPFFSSKDSDSGRKKISGSLTVDVNFEPNEFDFRKIDVKFESCRIIFQKLIDITIPLGPIGPTGWLRTAFIDDTIRITRGHKGSVFVLNRTSQRSSNKV